MQNLKLIIGIGDRIEVNIVTALNIKRKFISKVTNIINENMFDILTPIELKSSTYINRGSILEIVFAKGDAIYNLKARIINKLNDNVPVLRLEIASEINKIQRRNFFRLNVIKNFKGREIENIKEHVFGEEFIGNIIDISSGGVLISTSKDLHIDNIIEISFTLSNEKNLIILGLILRKSYNSKSKYSYEYGVKFLNITESERTLIMKYIFDEQRKQIRKGLI